ncbi:MarR family winged helix-turn-helix transcriptional regulator [Actinomadura kijaniata]|uniref:MarR family winged helix-turn-helix transcriptional regulator n=1 Tax=Actinomadura kijaniata TaxID=46161 RepID=UPI003F1A64A2
MAADEGIGEAVAWRPGASIKRAEQALIAKKTRALRPFELTVPQYVAMYALSANPGISGARLARYCAVTPQSMTTVLKTLEARGLVERRPSPDHSQVLITRLTAAGRELLARADEAAMAVEKRLSGAYTPDELEKLHELLDRAITVLTDQ